MDIGHGPFEDPLLNQAHALVHSGIKNLDAFELVVQSMPDDERISADALRQRWNRANRLHSEHPKAHASRKLTEIQENALLVQ